MRYGTSTEILKLSQSKKYTKITASEGSVTNTKENTRMLNDCKFHILTLWKIKPLKRMTLQIRHDHLTRNSK